MASDVNAAWAAVEKELNDNWDFCPIAWPGADFTPPETEPYWWLRATPLFGGSTMASMTTTGYNMVDGIWDLDLFDKPGNGYGILRDYADRLRDLFDRATIGTVEFQAAEPPRIIRNSQGWLHLKVSIPFTMDEQS